MPTISEIQSNVSSILAQYYANKLKASLPVEAPDPFNKEPDKKKIRGFQQNSRDEQGDSTLTARNVGKLIKGKTRLNIISALTGGDKVDFFKFTAADNQKFGISVKTDTEIRVQILNKNGKVIADSEAKFGDLHDNFEKAGAQKLELTKGDYFVKVTRGTGTSQNDRPNYAIQLSTTKFFTEDYDTIEKPAFRSINTGSSTYSAAGIGDLLTQTNGSFFDFANGAYYNKRV